MGSGCCPSTPVKASPAATPELDVCRNLCCSESDDTPLLADTSLDQGKDKAPDCCAGKSGPCCDTSCLNRLAMRECEDGPDTCDGAADGKACTQHSTSVLDRYSLTLNQLGCICRALIARGEETCCEIRDRHSAYGGSGRRAESYSSRSRSSLESLGSSSSVTKEVAAQNRLRLRGKGSGGGGGGGTRPTAVPSKPACAKSCCSPTVTAPVMTTRKGKEKATDAKQLSSCAKASGDKAVKWPLKPLPTLKIRDLAKSTSFSASQNQGSSLDLIIPGEPSNFIDQAWPDGIIEMVAVDKQTVRVTFDPKIVGPRDLAEKTWREPFNLAPPRGDASLEAGAKHVKHIGYTTLLSAVLTIPVLVMAWAPLPKREIAYASASFALATIVQVVIGGPFYPKALKALVFSQVIEMDLLIVLSTSAAYIFSVVSFGYLLAGKPLSTGQFFETSTLLVTLIMVGRWVAALARQRAVESISLESLQASAAILVENGIEREIDVRLLQYGDIFKVLPDTTIPTDGTIIAGSSETDESMLTGESKPVEKYPKSAVIAGSINGPGVLTVRLDRLPCENSINTIAAMVNEAKLSKPKLQNLADKVASYFVPVVVTLTIITFVIWVAIGKTIRHQTSSEAAIQAITYAITVLIVSCPCAIGLAVPMVVVIASGVAANKGIIFKSADAIEVGYKTSHVVFDKTGTLTRGKLSVTAEQCLDRSKLPLLYGLVQNSKHPVSVAIAAHLKTSGITTSVVPEPKSLTGKGVETTASGQKLQAGNSRWLNMTDHDLVQPMLANGHTVFCFSVDGVLTAAYGLEDELRPDAAATVDALKKRNISVHLVSGDDDGAVQACASKLGISSSNVSSRSSPAEKGAYVKKLDSVIFCGDGTNDAVALAQATIGVHINQGADIAQSAADVVLMRPHLEGILAIMNVSRKSVNRIWFNFGWSLVYNTFAILLAAGAFVNARIPPEFAGLGELVSVLPVIAAAVLLRWSNI
ncbi:copper-transporting ATPase [Beauveria bassiana ARSEF 2860]|uniref:Copper-transporting ATPase n=1 Tax=Beauveria bassiana (strain ARSEF 2860) TaxID=655819 RepID=J4W4H9_BEAB2|nr:copper-transporting ATPase [Beauveria bassiana ARSEF 2860]EJP65280.1 copper-transporting ATPase [Beauveria bassiana ARSEF 2860]